MSESLSLLYSWQPSKNGRSYEERLVIKSAVEHSSDNETVLGSSWKMGGAENAFVG